MPVTQSFAITTAAELAADIRAIDQTGNQAAPDTAYTFTLENTITLSQALDAINLDPGSSLKILGNGNTIDGGGTSNGLFAYQGTVDIQNLTIADAHAVGGAGGTGEDAGGGGAGLGGGLFVAAGATVSLSDVNFLHDAATGGAGGADIGTVGVGGGGGMLRGAGGAGTYMGSLGTGGGGGGVGGNGGVGQGAGQPGLIPGAAAGGAGYEGGKGGASGGGGGGGFAGTETLGGGGTTAGGAGGGGVAGKNGSSLGNGDDGGAGGFGGGGGGDGGYGGFGGGGAGFEGHGGFGGGGGASDTFPSARQGGFGGGNGGGPSGGSGGGGGSGLGAGGDIFVQQGGVLVVQGGTLGQGSVTGGAGVAGPSHVYGQGAASQPGDAFGPGLFIQGNQTVTLAPGGGEALTVAGSIADEHGSIGTYTPEGTLAIDGAGTVNLNAHNSFSGGILLDAGALALNTAGAGGSGPIAFVGSALLAFAAAVAPGNAIGDFAAGDTIEIMNFAGFAPTLDTYDSPDLTLAGLTLTVVPVPATVTLDIPGFILSDLTISNDGFETFLTTSQPRCFAAGTRIATPDGTRPVETLRPHDVVFTIGADGARRVAPVCWVGGRRLDLASHAEPELVAPVRIRAGALAPGLPARDLVLSPDHCLLLDGHLLRAFRLLNGVTVVQERPAGVVYWHVALPGHALLLAEGVAAESYLDEGMRGFFGGDGARPGPLHPRATPGCAPYAPDDAFAERLWRRVAARAGAGLPAPPRATEPRLYAGERYAGERCVPPVLIDGGRRLYALPPGARSLRLVSAARRPTAAQPWRADRRRLGAGLRRVRVDGETTLPLDGPAFGRGWHAPEQGALRWSDGDATLHMAPPARLIELHLAD